MAHGDAKEGKWRGNWRMEWVVSTLHTTSEHGVFSITTADAHTLAASSRLNWSPRRFKWTRPFRRKTKSGFCVCAITFQLACTTHSWAGNGLHPSEWPWFSWKRAGQTLNIIEMFYGTPLFHRAHSRKRWSVRTFWKIYGAKQNNFISFATEIWFSVDLISRILVI